jgi:hypothetical protein
MDNLRSYQMSDNKFKVGDMVVGNKSHINCIRNGMRGLVVSEVRLGGYDIRWNSGGTFYSTATEFDLVTDNNSNNNSKDTTAMTTSKFTETVTTTKTTIKEVIDGSLSNDAYISVNPNHHNDRVKVVVGARYEDRYCASFDKPSLQDLIDELQAVHDVMEDY